MQLVLNVVRGIDHWTVLRKIGVSYNENTWFFDSYPNPVSIEVNDLFMGFKNYSKDKLALQEWATFMLAASNLISFEVLENDLQGDKLLNALWDASFGEDITSFILSL